jgi:sugar (pentulose or hexulose) kinase
MTQFLGIDIGTTFVKGAVLDLDALQLRHIRRAPAPAQLPGLPQRHHELDPAAITAAIGEMIEALLPLAPRCAGIVLSTQMHSVVLVDQAGAPLTNVITWLDQRVLESHSSGGTYFEALAARLGPETRLALGNELRPGLPIATLFWLAERGELPPGSTPLTLADLALMQLCAAPPGIEATNAAAAGAFDVVREAWHPAALAATRLDTLSWPPIAPLTKPAGAYRSGGRSIPCYRPVGDAQCALAGAGLIAGELSINIATGSQVSVLRPAPLLGDFQTRPFFDGLALTTISGVPAGRALNVLVGLLSELAAAHGTPVAQPWPYLIQAAEAAPDSELRVQLGFFGGAEGEAGLIEGIREGNLTAGGLLRAAFRQMAASYEEAALRLMPDRTWRQLVLSGGLAHQSRLLRDLIATRLAAPVRLAPAEDALRGLLALALACAQRVPTMTEAVAAVRERHEQAQQKPDSLTLPAQPGDPAD